MEKNVSKLSEIVSFSGGIVAVIVVAVVVDVVINNSTIISCGVRCVVWRSEM